MPYVNPPILKVALVGPEVDALRLMYDLYGLVRLDTYSRSLFNLQASLGFEAVAPDKADCVLICTKNNNIPSSEQLEILKNQIKVKPSTLTLVVSLTELSQEKALKEKSLLSTAWNQALDKDINVLYLPSIPTTRFYGEQTQVKLNARHLFLGSLKKHLIYAGLLKRHLNSDELYNVHHFPDVLVNMVCEMIGNPIEAEENNANVAAAGACK